MGEIYNIPAGVPFAKALARQLLREFENAPEGLADLLILLPTRRACRTLRDAFLQGNEGQPILLPRLQALGDIDEEELSLSIAGQEGVSGLLNLPPSLSPMRRQILLARAIAKRPDFPHGFDQALSLAKDLGHVMDQIYTENLNMKDLASLVPEDFAAHWQITLDFLKILSEEWPKILEVQGVIDVADRRNRLILALSDFWQKHPPGIRIIAAGTTGSIPATAALLKTIYALPAGEIVLPGLDEGLDDASWEALGESHPQYGFKVLLEHLEVSRGRIQSWPECGTFDTEVSQRRRGLASLMMRPAETCGVWQGLKDEPQKLEGLRASLQNLQSYSCAHHQQEAMLIAVLMRSVLEQPMKTAALVTPDRVLAKRVAMACQRWGITVDDSAGTPLTHSPVGQFLMLVLQACESALSPSALLAMLKHPFCTLGMERRAYQSVLMRFEEYLLRGLKPPAGIAGLTVRLEDYEETKGLKLEDIRRFIGRLEDVLSPMLLLVEAGDKAGFKTLLKTHLEACEALGDADVLWAGEAGQSAAVFMADVLEHAGLFPDMHMGDYHAIVQQFLSAQTLRPAYGTHPRLHILGQLEARLIDADLVILGGLNEGTWPPDPGHDPWMSRPMRKEFGLPGAERSIGLAAHDFVQGFCAPNVVLTRSERVDGAPSVPARWLQRMETVLEAASLDVESLRQAEVLGWVQALDAAPEVEAISRPVPRPSVEQRPRRMRITHIDTWLKDPYSIYAYYILKLRKLDPLEKNADAAIRGQILHDVLDRFITAYPQDIPSNADGVLRDIAQETLPAYHLAPEDWGFYWPRFERIGQSFLAKEEVWRSEAQTYQSEVKGEMALQTQGGAFVLYGRADRIDRLPDGQGAIIDYKSGGQFSLSGMASGDLPQLPLEGLILQHGGFEGTQKMDCGYLGYWVLNTSGAHTETFEVGGLLEETQAALKALIEIFENPETPYHSVPRSDQMPRFSDYEHLARIKEWAALDEDGDSFGEAA